MQIKEPGKYKLTSDYMARVGSISGHKIKSGDIINVSQVDNVYHKVFAKELGDWNPWELPVEKIEDAPQDTKEQNGHNAQQAQAKISE